MDGKLPKRSRDDGRKYVSDWEKEKKKANETSTNKQKSALPKFLKRLKPESKNMATSSETAEKDSLKNATTAVVNVVRKEDNDVTLTAVQHAVMGNEQNVVD